MISTRVDEGLKALNQLPAGQARERLSSCCGSTRWAREMTGRRPFADLDAMLTDAGRVWAALGAADWLEAFRAHPRIGERTERPARSAYTARSVEWSAGEQSGVDRAAEDVRAALRAANDEYERRFGHIFIVCATGRSAGEMLEILRERLSNPQDVELRVAAAEQQKITELRIRKMLEELPQRHRDTERL